MRVKFFIIFLATIMPAYMLYATTTSNPPIPRARSEALQEKAFTDAVRGISLPKDQTNTLLSIKDPKDRARILDAIKNGCSKGKTQESASLNVEHKLCKPPGKAPKGKDGRKCQALGVKGGPVSGICLNGCCVYLSAGSAQGPKGGSQSGSSDSQSPASQTTTPGASDSKFLKEFGSLFKNLFSGSQGSGDSGYDYPYDNYGYYNYPDNDSLLQNNDLLDVDLDLPQEEQPSHPVAETTHEPDLKEQDGKVQVDDIDEETILSLYQKEHEQQTKQRYSSSLYKESQEEIKYRPNANTDSGAEFNKEDAILSIEARSAFELNQGLDDEKLYGDTGFDGVEKIKEENKSLWQKFIEAIKSLFI